MIAGAFSRGQTVALVLGAVGVVGGLVAGLGGGFFESYLMAFLFWLGLALGCLVLLLVNHVAGGMWGVLVQRPLEAGASVLPVMALLFLPVLFGMNALYAWTDAEYLASHPLVDAKTAYLNVPFFVLRAVVYFGLWVLAAWTYLRTSARQDEAEPRQAGMLGYRMRNRAGLWMVVYVLTMTFAGIDWAMSLTPAWWSGIYSPLLMISQVISATALVILTVVALTGRHDRIDTLLNETRLQDLGNYLMAFILFWAYLSASQLIILWSNNVIETNPWYVIRFEPGWVGVAAVLAVFGFFGPFLILFSRWVKRRRAMLSFMAVWALAVQLLNLFWFLAPTFDRAGFPLTAADVLLLVGLGGVWAFFFLRRLGSQSLLPPNDPRLKGAEHHA